VTRATATTPADAGSYYGRAVVKEPVWTWEIPWYFWAGGTSGASSVLALAARRTGNHRLARSAHAIALAGFAVSPPLLIKDLGRPERFLNMLRVFKVTSPMSLGTWSLTATATANGVATALSLARRAPRTRRAAEWAAAALGPTISTYTAALLADTSIPVWHEARYELPFLFAASSAASAGAAAAIATPPEHAGPARRLAVGGALAELATVELMERRLGPLAEPYEQGPRTARHAKLAKTLTAAGAVTMLAAGRRRGGAALAGALLLGGAAAERWAVFRAGFDSAADPRYTVEPQRRRLEERQPTMRSGEE
jgi:hypothetical protein